MSVLAVDIILLHMIYYRIRKKGYCPSPCGNTLDSSAL
jgi:hypothetical protein